MGNSISIFSTVPCNFLDTSATSETTARIGMEYPESQMIKDLKFQGETSSTQGVVRWACYTLLESRAVEPSREYYVSVSCIYSFYATRICISNYINNVHFIEYSSIPRCARLHSQHTYTIILNGFGYESIGRDFAQSTFLLEGFGGLESSLDVIHLKSIDGIQP